MSSKRKSKQEREEAKHFKIDIAQGLLESFASEPVAEGEVAGAEELITSIDFDLYEENNHCQILTGIETKHLHNIVQGLADRFQLTDEVTESILDSEYAHNNDKAVREFRFKLGEAGYVRYGRVATTRRDQLVDLAYSFYSLDFKFSAKQIEETKNEKLFLWNVSNVSVTKEERNVSNREKTLLLAMLRYKALEAFKQEYPLLTPPVTCAARAASSSPSHSDEMRHRRNFYKQKLEVGCCPFM